jgi:hypothetical protein
MENGNGITKADLKAALTELKVELTQELRKTSDELTEKMRQIETNLLTEFHRYGNRSATPSAYIGKP